MEDAAVGFDCFPAGSWLGCRDFGCGAEADRFVPTRAAREQGKSQGVVARGQSARIPGPVKSGLAAVFQSERLKIGLAEALFTLAEPNGLGFGCGTGRQNFEADLVAHIERAERLGLNGARGGGRGLDGEIAGHQQTKQDGDEKFAHEGSGYFPPRKQLKKPVGLFTIKPER